MWSWHILPLHGCIVSSVQKHACWGNWSHPHCLWMNFVFFHQVSTKQWAEKVVWEAVNILWSLRRTHPCVVCVGWVGFGGFKGELLCFLEQVRIVIYATQNMFITLFCIKSLCKIIEQTKWDFSLLSSAYLWTPFGMRISRTSCHFKSK